MFGIRSRVRSAAGLFLALATTLGPGGCNGGGSTPADAAADAQPAPDATPPVDAVSIDAFLADAWVPPHGATCLDPFSLTPGQAHSADTSALIDQLAGGCSVGSGIAPDAIYLLDLGETARDLTATVSIDEEAAPPFDVVLYARTDCADAETSIGCADASWGERLELLAVSGSVTLVVDGTDQYGGALQGPFTLSTAVRDIAGPGAACDPAGVTSRCQAGSRCVSSLCAADDAALACSLAVASPDDLSATTHAYAGDFYSGSCAHDSEASFPEHLYRIELAAASDLVATTDLPETDFDTYLYLRSTSCDGTEVGCHDDVDDEGYNLRSTLSLTALPAGVYYLFVDGSSASPGTGTYRLQVTVAPNS